MWLLQPWRLASLIHPAAELVDIKQWSAAWGASWPAVPIHADWLRWPTYALCPNNKRHQYPSRKQTFWSYASTSKANTIQESGDTRHDLLVSHKFQGEVYSASRKMHHRKKPVFVSHKFPPTWWHTMGVGSMRACISSMEPSVRGPLLRTGNTHYSQNRLLFLLNSKKGS